MALALVLGVPAAYAFARFRGGEDIAFTLLSFRFAPPLLVLLPLTLYFQNIGLSSTYIGLIWLYQLICGSGASPNCCVSAVCSAMRHARCPTARSSAPRSRAPVGEPGVLLLDDPLRNVDAKLRYEMRLELPRLLRGAGAATIYVTQDYREAMAMVSPATAFLMSMRAIIEAGGECSPWVESGRAVV